MTPALGLGRGAFTQLEAGLVAAWAGNLPPDPPAALGPEAFLVGDATSAVSASLTFQLADPDPGDRLRAWVEVSTRADFGVLAASAVTVAGPGGVVKVEVGPLPEGWQYWRVKAVDATGAESTWSVAAGGAAAFAVDDTPPSAGLEPLPERVTVGERVWIRGWVAGADVARWGVLASAAKVAGGEVERAGRWPVETAWVAAGPAGPATLRFVAEDVEGYRATVRVQVVISTTGRESTRPPAAPALGDGAFGFRSAALGPNPVRSGARMTCHLAVGQADEAQASWYALTGEALGHVSALTPVWHGGDLCYEPEVDTGRLASGVYLLVLEAEKEGRSPVRVVRKIVVAR